MAAGKKTGGRKPGSRNKATKALDHRTNGVVMLSSKRVEQILNGTLPCTVCLGKGKTLYQPSRAVRLIDGLRTYVMNDNPDEGEARLKPRTCLSCYGSGLEQVSPELIGKVALAVREEAYPKLKAIEHSGPDGGPIQHEHSIKLVD